MRIQVAAVTMLVVVVLCSQLRSDEPTTKTGQSVAKMKSVKFQGETFQLAWVAENHAQAGRELLNEYIRSTDTLETWTKLIAVRQYAHRTDYRQMAYGVVQALQQQNPLARHSIMSSPDGKRVLVDFVTWDLDAKITEFNVFIYQLDATGKSVVAQQFAMRAYGDGTEFLTKLRELRPKVIEEIVELKFPDITTQDVEHK